MGELSGHLFLVTALLAGATLAGCAADEPEPDTPPPPATTVVFGGGGCAAGVVSADADADAVDTRLPDGFAAVRNDVTDAATVEATLLDCLDGRIGDASLGVEIPMNFWYLETPVTGPDWAADGADSLWFVLAFHTSDPRIADGLAAVNVSLAPGEAMISDAGATASSPEGSLGFSAILAQTAPGGTERRHLVPQSNGTLAAWNIRTTPGGATGALYDVSADAGTVWAELAGTQTVGSGYHLPQTGSPLFEFGPGTLYWIGPPDGTA